MCSSFPGIDIEALSYEETKEYLIDMQALDEYEYEFGYLEEA